jgi:hypothetical protein
MIFTTNKQYLEKPDLVDGIILRNGASVEAVVIIIKKYHIV